MILLRNIPIAKAYATASEQILAALLKHKERVSDKLIKKVTAYLQNHQSAA